MALGEDIDFLEVQRRELLKEAVGDGDTSQIGDELWTAYRNQEGFILQAVCNTARQFSPTRELFSTLRIPIARIKFPLLDTVTLSRHRDYTKYCF